MLRVERADVFFWFVPSLVTFWDTLVANKVNKICQINLLSWQEGSFGAAVAQCTFHSYVHVAMKLV